VVTVPLPLTPLLLPVVPPLLLPLLPTGPSPPVLSHTVLQGFDEHVPGEQNVHSDDVVQYPQ